MSLFLRVERFGSGAQIWRLAGLTGQIGEDTRGALATQAPARAYFSIYCINERYLLRNEVSGLSVFHSGGSAQNLEPAQTSWLTSGSRIKFKDSEFVVSLTSSTAEALGANSNDSNELVDIICKYSQSQLPKLMVKLADLSKSVTLLPDIDYRIGQDPSSEILISLAGLKPLHCSIRLTESGVIKFVPLQGQVLCDDKLCGQYFEQMRPNSLTLLPPGLKLDFVWPSPVS